MEAKLIAAVITPLVVILVLSVVCAICCISERRRQRVAEREIDEKFTAIFEQSRPQNHRSLRDNPTVRSQQRRRQNEIPLCSQHPPEHKPKFPGEAVGKVKNDIVRQSRLRNHRDNPSVSSQQPRQQNEIPLYDSSAGSQQNRQQNEIPSTDNPSAGSQQHQRQSEIPLICFQHHQQQNEISPGNTFVTASTDQSWLHSEIPLMDKPSAGSQQHQRQISPHHPPASSQKSRKQTKIPSTTGHVQGSINVEAPTNPNKERNHDDKPPSIIQHQQQDTNPSTSSVVSSREPLQPHTPAIGSVIPRKFTYKDLSEATNDFSSDNLLGSGGFGPVHKGYLKGRKVAVKQLKPGSEQGDQEFLTEVITLSSCRHEHLVELIGYCMSGNKRLLVYEFIPNKSLKSHLHGNDTPVLEWQKRFKIALDTAKGLVYLHECPDGKTRIIHRDIKSENILLDENFEAKVADFGLAGMFANDETHVSTLAKGTFGYLDPDYYVSGHLTEKSDVYSFGMLLLELITGRKPRGDLALQAKDILTKAVKDNNIDFVDPKLQKKYDNGEMFRMVHCAAACVCYSARDRPEMSQIREALEGNLDVKILTQRIETRSNTDNSGHNEEFRKIVQGIGENDNSESSQKPSSSA